MKEEIVKVSAREILDSRGNPTVEAEVVLKDGSTGRAKVPSGASTGQYEALELRDESEPTRYGGKGVRTAVKHVYQMIAPAIIGISAFSQYEIDRTMQVLDGTDDKSRLGANAILSVSLAVSRAAAASVGLPLYRYLGGVQARRLPVPMMNILNGGAHAANNLDIQEFMIVPVGAENFAEGLRMGAEIRAKLGKTLSAAGYATGVGDEGGFAPDLDSPEQALDYIAEATEKAGYGGKVRFALDAAASEWQDGEEYVWKKTGKRFSSDDLIAYYDKLSRDYPILSIEDGLGENDRTGWEKLTDRLGDRLLLVGDDLFVTNPARFRDGIDKSLGNAVLVKPNQIGTLSETLEVMETAKESNYAFIPSHRSGDTEDDYLADLSVAANAPYCKTGAPCRSERVAKYNRLLEIEAKLGCDSWYG